MTQEKGLHARFSEHRAKLEWFYLRGEVSDFIKAEAKNWVALLREAEERRRAIAAKAEVDYALMMQELRTISRQTELENSTAYMLGTKSADAYDSMF